LREAVGLGRADADAETSTHTGKKKPKGGKHARIVSFRDRDGRFRYRLLAANGDELALSVVHADPKAAGMASRRLLTSAADIQIREDDGRIAVVLGGEVLAHAVDAAAAARITTELEALVTAQEA